MAIIWQFKIGAFAFGFTQLLVNSYQLEVAAVAAKLTEEDHLSITPQCKVI